MLPYLFNFSSIKNRREIIVDNTKIIDLTEQIFVIKSNLIMQEPPVLITKEFEYKPHIISRLKYGSEDYTDLLLLVNGIGSFVYLKTGMKLNIFTISSILNNIVDFSKEKTNEETKNDYANKMNKKDASRMKILIAASNNKKIGDNIELLSPNQRPSSVASFTPSNGVITLGTDVSNTRCKSQLSQNQIYTESIRKAVKEKILAEN